MKDYYSVREFAELTGVDSSKLRFYDSIGLFSPMRRDEKNNYRYYSLEQILSVNFISVLSDLGLPLKEIADLRNERNPEDLLKMLSKREKELDMELRTLRLRSSIIHARQELIRYGLTVDENEVAILSREKKDIIMWPRNEYEKGDTFVKPLSSFVNQADELRIDFNFPVGGYYDDFDSFIKHPTQPDHFFSIDPLGTHEREEGDYVIGFSRGFYAEF